MCIPTGQAELMSPQEKFRYEEATGGLAIPKAPMVAPRDDSYIPPKDASVKLADGRMISKSSAASLQQKLKNRGR